MYLLIFNHYKYNEIEHCLLKNEIALFSAPVLNTFVHVPVLCRASFAYDLVYYNNMVYQLLYLIKD